MTAYKVKRAATPATPAKAETAEQGRLKEVFDRIQRKFDTLRVAAPRRPVDEHGEPLNPVLVPDLTVLSDNALGKLFSEFACMAQYLQLYLAQRSVEAAVFKAEEKKIRAKVRLEKTGTNPDKEAKAEVDPRVRELGFHHLVSEGAQMMTDAMMSAYLIGRDATSREMTRRISLVQNERH